MMRLRAQSFTPAEVFMYTLVLILCIFAVILAPIALDLFLSFQEAHLERQVRRAAKEQGPQLVWASPRVVGR